jgi:hypothetical protein
MGDDTLLEDALILFGVLGFWGAIVGAISAFLWYLMHKE